MNKGRQQLINYCEFILKELKEYDKKDTVFSFYICNKSKLPKESLDKVINELAEYGEKHIPLFHYSYAFIYDEKGQLQKNEYHKRKIDHIERFIQHLKNQK